jgi:hypothetical protein
MVRVDGEGAINTDWFRGNLSLTGIILDITGAGEAVAVVERNVRQEKERFYAVSNTLPIKRTVAIEAWLVKFAVVAVDVQVVVVPVVQFVDNVAVVVVLVVLVRFVVSLVLFAVLVLKFILLYLW